MSHLRLRYRGAMAAFAVLLLLVHATGAAAEDCEVLDKYGQPRDCTFTEEFADCAEEAEDSWDQCWDSAWEQGNETWLDRLEGRAKSAACDAGFLVDLASCAPGSAFDYALH